MVRRGIECVGYCAAYVSMLCRINRRSKRRKRGIIRGADQQRVKAQIKWAQPKTHGQ